MSFVERSGEVFADLEAVVPRPALLHLARTRDRAARLAAALRSFGAGR